MKKSLLAFAAAAVLVFSACNKKEEEKNRQLETENKTLSTQLAIAQDSKDSLIFLMNDIYTGIEQINEQEELLYNIRGNGDQAMQRQTIVENLARIQLELKNKQAMLEKYNSQLNDGNDKNNLLRNQVATLQKKLASSESRVNDLVKQVESLQAENGVLRQDLATSQEQVRVVTTANDSLTTQTERQTVQLKENENEMNKVYYALGTKKELQNNQILGKGNKVLQGNYNQNYFTCADKRSLKYIDCKNKKAEVMSNQPADSYRFEVDANKNKTLVITNPDRFWNASRYLVIKLG